MPQMDWSAPENFRTTQVMLRDARRAIGIEPIKELLPAPFSIWVDDHDTGSQGRIQIQDAGHMTMVVWRGSVWYSSAYEFNDNNYVWGLAEHFNFARDILNKFFEEVNQRLIDYRANREADKVGELIKTKTATDLALEHYREIVTKKAGE